MSRDSFSTEALRRLIALDLSQAEVAKRLGVTRGAIIARLKREGLEWPSRRHKNAGQRADGIRPVSVAGEADDAALAGTGGRYVDLRAWAQARGLSHTQALQRWHRLGIPVKARRA